MASALRTAFMTDKAKKKMRAAALRKREASVQSITRRLRPGLREQTARMFEGLVRACGFGDGTPFILICDTLTLRMIQASMGNFRLVELGCVETQQIDLTPEDQRTPHPEIDAVYFMPVAR